MDEKVGFGYYIVIPTKIVQDDKLSPYSKLAFGIIANLSNSRGYCFATNKYLADILNLHENTVSRFVNELTTKGYILRFDEVINDQVQRRLFINAELSGYSIQSTRGQQKDLPGVNGIVDHNSIIRITNNNKTLSWFRAQFDDIYMNNVKMIHKGKDIEKAIEESYMHLASDQNRLHNADGADCKRLLNSWLSNAKGTKPKKQRMSDEEFLKGI